MKGGKLTHFKLISRLNFHKITIKDRLENNHLILLLLLAVHVGEWERKREERKKEKSVNEEIWRNGDMSLQKLLVIISVREYLYYE